jgi:hypothetical protein
MIFRVPNSVLFLLLALLTVGLIRCGKSEPEEEESLAETLLLEDNQSLLFNGENLDGWEITNFGPQGPVRIDERAVILGMGDGCTGIHYTGEFPREGYRVSLQAMRITGRDFFCGMTFPVGDEYCSFIVGGWGGSLVGISSIDGLDASENFTTEHMNFESGQWYDIDVRVTADSILTWIDGERIVSVGRSGHTFSTRPEVNLSRPFGICSWMTTAALRNIVLTHPLENKG